jgi:ribonuclease P protein component
VTSIVPGESNRDAKARAAKAGFPRSARRLRHADFERVYKSGYRHFSALATVFFWARREEPASGGTAATRGLRFGFTVGRALGNAVQRNRIRRRLREAVRLSQPPAEVDADVVINPRRSVLTADFQVLLNEMRRAFVAIREKLERTAEKPEAETGDRDSGSRKPGA